MKRSLGLRDERHAIGQEECIGHGPRAHEHVHQGRCRTRLARSRGHHEQASAVAFLHVLAHGLHSFNLVVAVRAAACNCAVHGDVG